MNCGGVADRIFDNLCHCATHCQLRNVMILLPSCTISHTSDSSPDFIESCLSKWTMTHLDYLLSSARQHVSRSARARDSQTSDSSSTLGKSLRAKKHT